MNTAELNITYSVYFKKYLKIWRFIRRLLFTIKPCVSKRFFNESLRLLNDLIKLDKKDLIVPEYENWISKSNKKLFIIGAGASLNNLSKKNWHEINDNFSIGLNFVLMHEFQADIYTLECGAYKDEYVYNNIYLELLKSKTKSGELLLNELHLPQNIVDRGKFLAELDKLKVKYQIHLPVRLPSDNPKWLEWIFKLPKVLLPKNDPAFGVHHNSSLAFAYYLGINLGFREIIFVGIDLNNVDYFFYRGETELEKKLSGLYRQSFEGRKIHRTADQQVAKTYSTLNSVDYIKLLWEFKGKKRVRTAVANPSSLLTKYFDVYIWK